MTMTPTKKPSAALARLVARAEGTATKRARRLRAADFRTTRLLARAAFDAGAISPGDFEFLLDSPDRAPEVLGFSQWLSKGGSK